MSEPTTPPTSDPEQECHEGVNDKEGYFVPCEKRAVGYRVDPQGGRPYPVCRKHFRAEIFVPSFLAVLDDFSERKTNAEVSR